MTLLHYRAIDETGQTIEESQEAASVDALCSMLEARGLTLLAAEESSPEARGGSSLSLKTAQLAMISKQLSTMLKAGVPIDNAFTSVASQLEEKQQRAFATIANNLHRGDSLSTILGKHPRAFRPIYTATVAAAERVGALETAFQQLSDMLLWEVRLMRDVKGALRYPATVMAAMLIAVVVLQQLVVPQFAKMFEQMKGELPLPTRLLMLSTDVVSNYWWALLAGLVVLLIGARKMLNTDSGRLRFDRSVLKLPMVGVLLQRMYLARFSRTLGLLQANGLPILEALRVLRGTVGNTQISSEVADVEQRLEVGETLSEAIGRQPSFDRLVKTMVQVGEKSGQLDDTLQSVSDYYEDQTRGAIQALTEWIEPALTVVLGGFVLFLALAIFLPWWDMTSLYKGS